ncbi:MAG: tryptophan--tRNA ligase [Parcubacteria group bacterium CG10_big_fil_rev_8_21_14_0_10_36_14]|nr:MAG: tryptophan--tRNA ligase [Parcubacteria group bacterium CG10_big_fil_rev_8_21_14_0_10_36_14]
MTVKKQSQQIIYSGIQPTGLLHIGNYFGALKNFVVLQSQYKCYFTIVDLHSLATNFDPKEKPKQILSLAMDYLALGLDPKKCTIFVQSHVPEVTELAWIFNCITPVKELERMTQFKDKAVHQKKNVNMGLFDYPVLQAADILLFKSGLVPVGEDQAQHIELTRDIAKWFNARFGETFPLPEALLTESPRVMSLSDPFKKMSKSMGEKSYIALTDDSKIIKDKISKAVTEPSGIIDEKKIKDNPGMMGAYNLLEMLRLLGNKKQYDRFKKIKKISYKDLKEAVAHELANHFELFRKHRAVLQKNEGKVQKILEAGAKKARIEALKTIEDVRKRVGIR